MFHKVKSSFILNKIFNFVKYKIKFHSIVHNKKLQIKLDLNLIEYRIYSGRYKKIENGKTTKYNQYNQIVFEGEYSNGKRNGKGKEYNEKGELIFEGDYLNGKKWKGFGKDYDEDTGKLIFKCEYLDGIINGDGKEYDKYNGKLLFSGRYMNGKRKGHGEEYKYIRGEKSDLLYRLRNCYKRITIFSGEYLNGERKE